MEKAEKERTQTIDAVNQLNQQLLDSSRQGSTIIPINFDAKAYQNSDIYKMKKDIENSLQRISILQERPGRSKKTSKNSRGTRKPPMVRKLWDTTKTFTGEVSGYYDYKRATEGVDPVNRRKAYRCPAHPSRRHGSSRLHPSRRLGRPGCQRRKRDL
ncbi:pre-toxin TG domain-containing protein [Metabacillus idriensis]|uniref:Pre-toxin TG domain-containing protein n=1 Tax=Metabacillus idriensis TaxID=324768 RepID=A0A6I2MDI7_9BACI|nr:pre-toxin TG domain-containing protein [Metabacillus idriensis]MCM3598302.1 pre-toxin TG domain-containing protein [Metabacillus idriensis]MRX55076.1 hypothetical protein [Metabacillus idriensis]